MSHCYTRSSVAAVIRSSGTCSHTQLTADLVSVLSNFGGPGNRVTPTVHGALAPSAWLWHESKILHRQFIKKCVWAEKANVLLVFRLANKLVNRFWFHAFHFFKGYPPPPPQLNYHPRVKRHKGRYCHSLSLDSWHCGIVVVFLYPASID